MNTVRWGIIGCGDVTEVKSGPAFAKARGSALVAVMRRDASLAADYARRHGVPRWYANAEALIHDPDVDAVYIATPPDAHREYTLLAAGAGKPVYVEKPMALNAAECEEMIAACRDAGVPLFVAYYRRALPRFLEVRRLLGEGVLGEVRAVDVALHRADEPVAGPLPWRLDRARSGGGLFVDLAPHTLDLLDYLFGPVTGVAGGAANQARRYAVEDVVHATLTFASGVRGVGLWSFSGWGDLDRVEILGTRGRMTFATFADAPIVVETDAGAERLVVPHPTHIQQPLIQTIVDALNGQGECPSTGETGARTTRVIDQLLREYYEAAGSGPVSPKAATLPFL